MMGSPQAPGPAAPCFRGSWGREPETARYLRRGASRQRPHLRDGPGGESEGGAGHADGGYDCAVGGVNRRRNGVQADLKLLDGVPIAIDPYRLQLLLEAGGIHDRVRGEALQRPRRDAALPPIRVMRQQDLTIGRAVQRETPAL